MPTTMTEITQRYWLRYKLGDGGMGEVYAALDRLTGSVVALKRVLVNAQELLFNTRPLENTNLDLRRILASEFRMLASLRHPHIISVLDYGFDVERFPYYTMTLIEDARTIIQAGETFTMEQRIKAFAETLQALAYLHRRNILHRDIKPGNILVDSAGGVKVLDFGLAAQDTSRGMSGTIGYMAPETMLQGLSSPQSDMYSLGVVAYQLFTGRFPFFAEASNQLLEQLVMQIPDADILPENVRPIIMRMLMKDPSDRYSDADSILADLAALNGGSVNIEDARVRESFLQAARFVGRERELGVLTARLDQINAQAGAMDSPSGEAYLIGGESGVGKSRLLDELRTYALLTGALVLRGQCVADTAQPFQMWREVVRRLLLEHEVSDLEASILWEIVPDIPELVGRAVTVAPILNTTSARSRLVDSILNLFRRQTQPTVLILEDLQWGLESLLPLKQLIPLCQTLPLLIVGSYRNDEAPNLLSQLPDMQALTLGRLTPEEIADLSRAMIGTARAQPYLVEYLHKKSEGNVLFLVEVIRALAENVGNLRNITTMTTLPEQVIAGGIERIVARRLERLPIEAAPTLQFAAVAGRDIDEKLIRWLVGEEADRWLRAGIDAAILEIVDERLRFAHDRLRAAVISMIPESEMAQYHQSIAEGLETLYPDDDNFANVLFEHWRLAGNTEKEAYYAVVVIQQRLLLGILNEARHLLEKVQMLKPQDPVLQLRMYCLAGEIYYDSGKPQLSNDAYMEALRLAQRLKIPEIAGLALEGLGNAAQLLSHFDHALDWYGQSLKLRREIGDSRGIASALHFISVSYRLLGKYDEAGKALEESLNVRRQINDERGMSDSLYQLSVRERNQGNYALAIRYLQESLELRRRLGDGRGLGDDLNNLGICYTLVGEYKLAFEMLNESLIIRQRSDNQRGAASTQNSIGEFYLPQNNFGMAIRHFSISLDVWQDKAETWNIANSHASVGYTQARAREVYSARHHLYESLQIARSIPAAFVILKALIGWAQLRLYEEQDYQAAILLGAVDVHPAMTAQLRQIYFNPIVAQLDKEMYATEYEMGKTMDMGGLINKTLSDAKPYFEPPLTR